MQYLPTGDFVEGDPKSKPIDYTRHLYVGFRCAKNGKICFIKKYCSMCPSSTPLCQSMAVERGNFRGMITGEWKGSEKISLSLNGISANFKIVNGYAVIKKTWKKGDVVLLNLPMPVRRIVALDEVKEDLNRVALQRGPLVYCFEHVDNDGKAMNIVIPDNIMFTAEFKPDLLNGIVVLQAEAPIATVSADGLNISIVNKKITAIPFYSWANRGEGQMQVWVPRKITSVRLLSN